VNYINLIRNYVTMLPEYLSTFARYRTYNCKNMSKILFIGGFILIIAWAIVFFGFHISGVIHILPAIAIIGFIIRLIYNKSFVKNKY